MKALADDDCTTLLAELRASVASCVEEWVGRSVDAKGWRGVPGAVAEEWASGPLPVARFLAHLHASRAAPRDAVRPRAQIPARIPGLGDAVLLRGHRVRFDVAADGSNSRTRETDNWSAGDPRADLTGQALVLGAGNVTATPVLDVLDQVFLRGRAVVLKPSPLHASLHEVFTAALAPLVSRGLVQLAAGDASAGRALAQKPDITAVHLTGSSATWAALRADPTLRGKQLTAEVGCCTPVFVVPGTWRERELRHAAAQLAAFVAMNGGAMCVAPRVLLTAAGWPQRAALRGHLRAAFAALPPRAPFHPGVPAAYAAASGVPAPTGALPPVLAAERDLRAEAELCDRELFAPVLREAVLPGADVAAFLQHAAAFARERCFGSLSAYVFAPPQVLASARAAIDGTVTALPHGTVAINTWTGVGYGLGTTPWGVPADAPIEHGSGWARDTTFADVQRVVIEAPFRPHPLPPWMPAHRAGLGTLRALTLHTLRPSLLRLAAVAAFAVTSS
ncbi:MAG TPA: aldehyde dehydrogenase family protein [Planctomycetota bacterium]